MAFCLKRKESVAKAVRRLGRERLEKALGCLVGCRDAEAIHCARKEIKKVRAVLRLVRRGISEKKYCRQNRLLREAAKYLAAPRDADVKVKTMRNLLRHFKGQLTPGALRHLRSELRSAFVEEMKRFAKEEKAGRAAQVLRRAAKKFRGLEVRGKGWKALGPGVKRAYRQGRRACQTVLQDSAPENFHEWRKRAKDLWYEVSLLRPLWPEQMDALASELEVLGEYLGDDHDLVVLQQSIRKRCANESAQREFKLLHGLIDERQRELRAAAVALGSRFYGEKPSTFCDRLTGYWHAWKREEMACAGSAGGTP